MGTVPNPADNGNEVSYVARVNLARSILNQRAHLDGFTEAEAERACYEARMALEGDTLEQIAEWAALSHQPGQSYR